jgi:RNA recognition motif-containing protein
MGKHLYVGNLNYETTKDALAELFSEYGEVVSVRIIEDKGYGFVEMETDEAAAAAKKNLNLSELDGCSIRVNDAHPRPDTSGGDRWNRRRGRW